MRKASFARPQAGSGYDAGAIAGCPTAMGAEKPRQEPTADGFHGWSAGCNYRDVDLDCGAADPDIVGWIRIMCPDDVCLGDYYDAPYSHAGRSMSQRDC